MYPSQNSRARQDVQIGIHERALILRSLEQDRRWTKTWRFGQTARVHAVPFG